MGGLTRTLVASLVAVGATLAGSAAAAAAAPDSVVGCARRCSAPAAPAAVPSGGCSRPDDDLRVRCLFDATGEPEHWVVPPDVSFVHIDAWGAGGGVPAVGFPQARSTGGRGAGISATVDVVGGETLTIAVGARGRPTRDDFAPSDGADRHVVSAAGEDTTVADFAGHWLVAGGGGGAFAAAEGRGWFGVGGAPGSASIRPDRQGFGARIDPLAKVGDGRLRLVYDLFDRDGRPSVVVRPVSGHTDGRRHFTVVFSEPVTGFTAEDVQVDGADPGRFVATVRAATPFDGAHYAITVFVTTPSGTVTAVVPAGVATDDEFSTNTASSATP